MMGQDVPGGVQLALRRRGDIADDIVGVEHDRAAIDDDLQRLKLAAVFETLGIVGDIPVNEGIRLASASQGWARLPPFSWP